MINLRTVVKRGKLVESIHEIKCLVKNSNFKILLSSGNNQDLVYPRSSVKVFQAIPFVLSGALQKYNLDEKIVAISCSSHCGESQHLIVLNNWINKISISIDDLKCGSHNPINQNSSKNLLLSGHLPNQLHNNCAGKHLGMISGCMAYKMPYDNYIDFDHPYQKLIRDSLEYFMGHPIQSNCIGTDGCGAPQYAFALNNLADSMIRIYSNNHNYSSALATLLSAIKKHPELIGGEGRFDSEIIKYTNGRIFCKGGAEGVLLFSDYKSNIGGVLKVADGNERAIPSIAIQIFDKLKLINEEEKVYFKKWINQKTFNHTNKEVGEIFSLIQ